MNRRQFLARLSTLLLAAAASASAGCSRLLEWSSRQTGAASRDVKPLATSSEPASVPATPSAPHPDLAVVKGKDAARNVEAALKDLGGIERFVKRGAKVVIKPNLLVARTPEQAVTTNPELVGAVVALCLRAGASDVVVLDRSMDPVNQVLELSRIAAATTAAGGRVKILTDRNFENTRIPRGRLLREWPLVTDVFDADVFINMPIAKHHGMAGLTMAMKNLMGIMGGARSQMHIDFDQKIVDLNTLVRPHLVILDAYRILVRNGPGGGDLADVEHPKTVVAGTSQVAIDAYGTTFFGMHPSDLPYLVNAAEQGLGEIDLAKLKISKGRA